MNHENLDAGLSKVAEKIGEDLFVAAKSWFSRLDPTGKKLSSYREGISSSLGTIQIMGMSSPRKLKQLYIALRAMPIRRRHQPVEHRTILIPEMKDAGTAARKILSIRNQSEIEAAIKDIGYGDLLIGEDVWSRKDIALARQIDGDVANTADAAAAKQSAMHGLKALTLVMENDQLIVLGQPGSGKTTFLKYIALAYTGFVPIPEVIEPLLPVFVPLRELKRVGAPAPQAEWLLAFIFSCASEISGSQFSKSWLKHYLEKKQCLILLDGIDEADPAVAGVVMQSITAFAVKYRGNKFIATCRSAVFDYSSEGFKICEIDDFNEDDVAVFVGQWFLFDQSKKADLLAHIKGSKPAMDLCKTPLLLTMLCILYEYNQTIPQNRSELYQTCVDALFFRWDSFRYITRPSLTQGLTVSRKKMILAKIARQTFDKDVYFFKKNALLDLLGDELARSNLGKIEPACLLEELESHNGLFVERAANVYSFSHLTFHEFFTALAYREENAEQKLLERVLSQQRYQEVFLMCLEKMYSADRVCIGLAAYIKNRFIDTGEPSEYFLQLVAGVLLADVSLDPKTRSLLTAVRGDLFASDILGVTDDEGLEGEPDELDFNRD